MAAQKRELTGGELMAQLNANPEYVAMMADKAAKHAALVAINQEAVGPVLADIKGAGYDVRSLRELRTSGVRYVSAVPILLDWFERVENVDIKQEIVRTLSVPWASPLACAPMIRAFVDAQHEGLRWVIGNALELIADKSIEPEMLRIASDAHFGMSRQMIVLGIARYDRVRVLPILVDQLNDRSVSVYAIMALVLIKAVEAMPLLEQMVGHADRTIRKEATMAIRKLRKMSIVKPSPVGGTTK